MTFTKGYGKKGMKVAKLPNALEGKGVKKIPMPTKYSSNIKREANLNAIPKTVAKTVKGAAKKIGKVY